MIHFIKEHGPLYSGLNININYQFKGITFYWASYYHDVLSLKRLRIRFKPFGIFKSAETETFQDRLRGYMVTNRCRFITDSALETLQVKGVIQEDIINSRLAIIDLPNEIITLDKPAPLKKVGM